MAQIIPFKRPVVKNKNKTMCRAGHHKWIVDKKKQFEVKTGKLVTVYRCKYCDKPRVSID